MPSPSPGVLVAFTGLSSAPVTVPPRAELDKRPPAKPPAVLRVTGAGRQGAQEMGKGRGREKGKGLLLSAAGSAYIRDGCMGNLQPECDVHMQMKEVQLPRRRTYRLC